MVDETSERTIKETVEKLSWKRWWKLPQRESEVYFDIGNNGVRSQVHDVCDVIVSCEGAAFF